MRHTKMRHVGTTLELETGALDVFFFVERRAESGGERQRDAETAAETETIRRLRIYMIIHIYLYIYIRERESVCVSV